MATNVTTDVKHAVFSTFDHQRGAELAVDSRALYNLLVAGDLALDGTSGGFFETIGETFVFVLEEQRDGSKSGERYFDVFTMPVDRVEQVNLPDLLLGLVEHRVNSYNQEPEDAFTIELKSPSKYVAESTDNPDYPSKDNTPENTVEAMFIAEMWEQLRRESVQCSATDDEVNRFISVVDGAIRELNFICPLRRETDYFDITGEKELEPRFEPGYLRQIVINLQSEDKLSYKNLPTYRDELENLRRHQHSQIASSRDIQETIYVEVQSFSDLIEAEADQYTQYAAKLMQEAQNNELENDRSTGDSVTQTVSEMVSGRKATESELLNPEAYNSLDSEVVEMIDIKLSEERQRIRERIAQDLIEKLEESVVQKFDDRSERLAMEVVQKMQEANRSDVAERASLTNQNN